MTTIALRAAVAGDFDFLFGLHRDTLGPYVDQVWGWNDDDQRAYLRATLDIATTDVITVDGADAGRLNVAVAEDDVCVGLIEIAPHLQRRGIGARIIRSIQHLAAAHGKGVQLRVLAVNTDAHRFYRRLGFRDIDTETDPLDVHVRMHAESELVTDVPHLTDPIVTQTWESRWGLRYP